MMLLRLAGVFMLALTIITLSTPSATMSGVGTLTLLPSGRTLGSLSSADLGTTIRFLDGDGSPRKIRLSGVLHDRHDGKAWTYIFDEREGALMLDSDFKIIT